MCECVVISVCVRAYVYISLIPTYYVYILYLYIYTYMHAHRHIAQLRVCLVVYLLVYVLRDERVDGRMLQVGLHSRV